MTGEQLNQTNRERKIIALDKLVSTTFQKKIRNKLVNRIVNNFRPELFHPIEVGYIDGAYIVWDGQHKQAAAKIMGLEEVECIVSYGLTMEDLAALFLLANDKESRSQTTAYEKYKASIVANQTVNKSVEISQSVKGILDKYEIKISNTGKVAKNGKEDTVYCSETLFKIANERGEQNLDDTLYILKNGFHVGTGAFSSALIQGMSNLLYESALQGKSISVNRMVNVLKVTSVAELQNDAKGIKILTIPNRYKRCFGLLYNKGLIKVSRIPESILYAV